MIPVGLEVSALRMMRQSGPARVGPRHTITTVHEASAEALERGLLAKRTPHGFVRITVYGEIALAWRARR